MRAALLAGAPCARSTPHARCSKRTLHASRNSNLHLHGFLRRGACVQLRAVSDEAAAASSGPDVSRRPELLKGVNLLLQELRGLDFPQREVLLYLQGSTKPPKAYQGFDVKRVLSVYTQIASDEGEAITDIEALDVLKATLGDVWKWRRLGYDSWRDELPPHQLALQQMQGQSEQMDPDRVQSLLLDNLNISDAEKQELSSATGGMIMASVQSFVWGGVVLAVLFLIGFNFLRGA